MKVLYKPFAYLSGLIAGRLAAKLAELLWGVVDNRRPPSPTTDEASLPRVLGAAAIQGATSQVTRAAVDRATARGFQRVFGVWPGESDAEQA